VAGDDNRACITAAFVHATRVSYRSPQVIGMARKRKTAAEQRQESAARECRAWDGFASQLEAVKSFAEAQALVANGPRVGEPGRRYYSNLGFFLGMFSIPDGSNADEKLHYLRLVQRIDAAGGLKPGAGQKVVESLRRGIEQQGG
jgi:hypothetical protein